jgi:hypothetical protein
MHRDSRFKIPEAQLPNMKQKTGPEAKGWRPCGLWNDKKAFTLHSSSKVDTRDSFNQ